MDNAREIVKNAIEHSIRGTNIDWPLIKNNVRDALSNYVFQKTKRHPMILPIIINA